MRRPVVMVQLTEAPLSCYSALSMWIGVSREGSNHRWCHTVSRGPRMDCAGHEYGARLKHEWRRSVDSNWSNPARYWSGAVGMGVATESPSIVLRSCRRLLERRRYLG